METNEEIIPPFKPMSKLEETSFSIFWMGFEYGESLRDVKQPNIEFIKRACENAFLSGLRIKESMMECGIK